MNEQLKNLKIAIKPLFCDTVVNMEIIILMF